MEDEGGSEAYLDVVKPPVQPRVPYDTSELLQRADTGLKKDLERSQAVRVIERWWRVVKDRKVFSMLKQAICAAEYSLTQEVIRKVAPTEAELLTDPAIQAKIKFRFGGEQFPPLILFKIFTCMSTRESNSRGTGGVKYLSGRRMIKPASEAAEDALRQMGNRKFYDQMLEDACQHQQCGITDETDIINMKDYMQYMANTDENPAYLGGKDNTWRQLDHTTTLPRHTPLHNLMDLLDEARLAGRVPLHQLQVCARPLLTQQQQARAISVLTNPHPTPVQRSRVRSAEGGRSGGQRRSRQARRRAELMRKTYQEGGSGRGLDEGEGSGQEGSEEEEIEEAWEEDAEDLYQWTQNLSFADIR